MSEPENPETTPESRDVTAKIDAVRQFVQMMKDNELTALDFIEGSTRIRLRRASEAPASGDAFPPLGGFGSPTLVYQPGAYPPGQQAGPTGSPPPPPPAAPPAPAAPSPPGLVIESPMVGTFYSSSSPDAPSFVSVGSTVRSDTTVCIIEAMKVFTDIPAGSVIPAGSSGTITEVLVKNGQSVEYGQPLFRIKLG